MNRLTAKLVNCLTAWFMNRMTAKLVDCLTAKLMVVNLVKLHLTKFNLPVHSKPVHYYSVVFCFDFELSLPYTIMNKSAAKGTCCFKDNFELI